jgi:molybdopterin-guanine dinucleotide biosynthesis protein
MSKNYYECHVTVLCEHDNSNTLVLKSVIEEQGWKFSQIEGDIALGAGIKCYATMHYNSRSTVDEVLVKLHKCADAIVAKGFSVIRRKIELVIYDDRSSKVAPGTCEGACIACHLDDYEERDCQNSKVSQ